ncbi:MAG: phosphoribosyl-ATP diphosphatase [Clostridiales bacterium]|nr:phosphoribosyl-ATP diphosphatase [Clostridiales bacterium]
MPDILTDLYEIVERRRAEREEGSYTVYLFDSGLDKILKKLGEEAAETIIAAKNLKAAEAEREALVGEAGDLIYHLVVMLNELGVPPEEVEALLRERMKRTGNLKKPREK